MESGIAGTIGSETLPYGASVLAMKGERSLTTKVKCLEYREKQEEVENAIYIPENFGEEFFSNLNITSVSILNVSELLSNKDSFSLELDGQIYEISMGRVRSRLEERYQGGAWSLNFGKSKSYISENSTKFIEGIPGHTISLIRLNGHNFPTVLISKINPTTSEKLKIHLPDIVSEDSAIKALKLEGFDVFPEEVDYVKSMYEYLPDKSKIEMPRDEVLRSNKKNDPASVFLYTQMRNYYRRIQLFSFVNNENYTNVQERIIADEAGLYRLNNLFHQKINQYTLRNGDYLHEFEIPAMSATNIKYVSTKTAGLVNNHLSIGYMISSMSNIVVDNIINRISQIEKEPNPEFRWYVLAEAAFHEENHAKSPNVNKPYEELFCRYVSEILASYNPKNFPTISEMTDYQPLKIFQEQVVNELLNLVDTNEIYWEEIFRSEGFSKVSEICLKYFGNRRVEKHEILRQIILATTYRIDNGVEFHEFKQSDDLNVLIPILGIASLYESIQGSIGELKSFDELFAEDDYSVQSKAISNSYASNMKQRFMIELHKQIIFRAGV